jgi:hypothetical protein
MEEVILVESYSSTSRRHAMVADDGCTGWLYLHAPSENPQQSGAVDATCFVFNRGEPIDVAEVSKYRPAPPPIATGYASKSARCAEPETHQWRLVWSIDGEAVLLMKDDELWCLITPGRPRGYSRAIQAEGPWGSAWSEAVFQGIEWPESSPPNPRR